jgi:hypothetical protein
MRRGFIRLLGGLPGITKVAVFGLCGLLVASLSATAAHAADGVVQPNEIFTCGVRSNYFDGYYHDPSAHADRLEGASAFIVNRFGSVCDTDHSAPNPGGRTIGTNFSTAWTMIAAYDGLGWAQTGFIRGYLSPQYEWAEFYNPDTGVVYNRFPSNPSLPDGATHADRELWNGSCACIQMTIDGALVTQTNFNPFAVWYAGPNGNQFSPQFSGETTYKESDIPGVSSSKTRIYALGAQRYDDDVLASMPCTLSYINSNTARWTHSAASCTDFSIWTSS